MKPAIKQTLMATIKSLTLHLLSPTKDRLMTVAVAKVSNNYHNNNNFNNNKSLVGAAHLINPLSNKIRSAIRKRTASR
jgi:hypothetical protein